MQHGVIFLKTIFVALLVSFTSSIVSAQSLDSFGIKTFEIKQNKNLTNLNLKTAITDQGMVYFDEEKGIYFTRTMPMIEKEGKLSLVDQELIQQFVDTTPFIIEHKADNEKILVTMFTDIHCGWCQSVHQSIDEYTNAGISFRFILFSKDGLKSDGARQMSTIIESENPYEMMQAAFAGQYITPSQLSAKITTNYYAGLGVGVGGTPTFVINGRPIEGRLLPQQILQAAE